MDEKQIGRFDYLNEYQKKNYDRITILRKKGDKEKLKQIAKEKYNIKSVSEFVNMCIDEKLKRMKIDI